jgi:hypothetical protein
MIGGDAPSHFHSGPGNPRRGFEQWGHLCAFPTLLETEEGFPSSARRAREVAATIEATGVFDGSTAGIPPWVSLLDVFEKTLVPHPSTFDWILKANLGFVIEHGPEFGMTKR